MYSSHSAIHNFLPSNWLLISFVHHHCCRHTNYAAMYRSSLCILSAIFSNSFRFFQIYRCLALPHMKDRVERDTYWWMTMMVVVVVVAIIMKLALDLRLHFMMWVYTERLLGNISWFIGCRCCCFCFLFRVSSRIKSLHGNQGMKSFEA